MESIRAVAWSVDGDDWLVQVKWVGSEGSEAMWEATSHIFVDEPKYLVRQLRKLKLPKDTRGALRTKHDIKV